MPTQLCPHCLSTVPPSAGPARCAACRLIIGAGRTITAGTSSARTRHASGAQIAANRARREGAEPVDVAMIDEAVRLVAADLGVATDRLRLSDYQQALEDGEDGPSVAEILATCGTWKHAVAQAAQAALESPSPAG